MSDLTTADNHPAENQTAEMLGPYQLNAVTEGNCVDLINELPEESVDLVITSPPYWGQRISFGIGDESDPREYLDMLGNLFVALLTKLKPAGALWINIGDAYNTPVNWREKDYSYSSLGSESNGLPKTNSAYVKPRAKRRAFVEETIPWLTYGNLLALPYRLVIGLCDRGYLFRGEVIWRKKNPMPEGKCRRPHRQHESIYLMTKEENHQFRTSPPVGSVWEFANEQVKGTPHYSRFPSELPKRCIEAYGISGPEVVVLDPFSGSGTTGMAARHLDCSYIGFEIDPIQVDASNKRLRQANERQINLPIG